MLIVAALGEPDARHAVEDVGQARRLRLRDLLLTQNADGGERVDHRLLGLVATSVVGSREAGRAAGTTGGAIRRRATDCGRGAGFGLAALRFSGGASTRTGGNCCSCAGV